MSTKKDYYKIGRSEYNKTYYLKNKEKIDERNKKYRLGYYQDNKEKIALNNKKWQEDHPELVKSYKKKWIDSHKEHKNKTTRLWQKNNPELVRRSKVKSEAKRRAIKQNVLVSITLQEMNELIQNSKNICFWCDEYIPEGKMHLDHVYPLSRGGGHTISNIVVSCANCNMKKHNKDPETWLYEVLNDNKT